MTTSPSCPISYGQPIPGKRPWPGANPWAKEIKDLIDQIPRATDLRSAILALNRMNNIVMMLNRGAPMVNNIKIPREPDVSLPGQDYRIKYDKLNWFEEHREYETQKLYNPDAKEQYIEIKTLKFVEFYNGNTTNRLNYYSKVA